MAKKTCPRCGVSVESSRTSCPSCRSVFSEKSSIAPYLIFGSITVIMIVVVAFFLFNSPSPQITIPTTVAVQPAAASASVPPGPSCTIGITGSKMPPSSVRLQVMSGTCSRGEVTRLTVSINGVERGNLGTDMGTSGTFEGTSGANSVIVVAKFANGAENVVFQNTAL